MSRTPLPSAANDPVVRRMRESCARFTDTAQNAGLLAPLLLLIAEAFACLFGRLEGIFLLWRAGALPPPPARALPAPKPLRVPRMRRSRTTGKLRSYARRRAPMVRLRRSSAPRPVASEPSPPHPNAPRPRVDRYPKPLETACYPDGKPAPILLRYRNNTGVRPTCRAGSPHAGTSCDIPQPRSPWSRTSRPHASAPRSDART